MTDWIFRMEAEKRARVGSTLSYCSGRHRGSSAQSTASGTSVPGTWLVCMAVSGTGGHPWSTFLSRPYFPLLWSYLWSPTHAFATFPVVPFLPSPGGVLGNGFSGGIWRVLISLHFVWCSCLMSCCQGDLSIFPCHFSSHKELMQAASSSPGWPSSKPLVPSTKY